MLIPLWLLGVLSEVEVIYTHPSENGYIILLAKKSARNKNVIYCLLYHRSFIIVKSLVERIKYISKRRIEFVLM